MNRIRQLRRERGMTQRELSLAAGCGRSFLSEIETGNANPTQAVLQMIATALHVPLAEVVGENIPDKPDDNGP